MIIRDRDVGILCVCRRRIAACRFDRATEPWNGHNDVDDNMRFGPSSQPSLTAPLAEGRVPQAAASFGSISSRRRSWQILIAE